MTLVEAIRLICPLADQRMAHELDTVAASHSIDTPLRQSHWLAQLAHESGGMARLDENLNYSSLSLRKTWPSRFDMSHAAEYARQPQRIGNRAYANRLGNGDEASGDGYRFRGRGLIQLTGRDNFMAASIGIFKNDSLVKAPEMVETPSVAAKVAGWFWTKHNLNKLADKDDLSGITRIINGGFNGFADRKVWLDKFKHALM